MGYCKLPELRGVIGNSIHRTVVFPRIGWTVCMYSQAQGNFEYYVWQNIFLDGCVLHKHLDNNVPEGADGEFVNKEDSTPRASNKNEHVVETVNEEEVEEEDYDYETPGGTTNFEQVIEEDKQENDCDNINLWDINKTKLMLD